jgi:hypothetical protein
LNKIIIINGKYYLKNVSKIDLHIETEILDKELAWTGDTGQLFGSRRNTALLTKIKYKNKVKVYIAKKTKVVGGVGWNYGGCKSQSVCTLPRV